MRKPIFPILAATIIFTFITIGLPRLHPDAFGTNDASDSASAPKKKSGGIGGVFKAIGRFFGDKKKSSKDSDAAADDTTVAAEVQRGSSSMAVKRVIDKDNQAFETVVTAQIENGPRPVADITPADNLNSEEQRARGKAFLNEGKNTMAIIELSSALEKNPKLTDANLMLAIAYVRMGFNEQARMAYRNSDGSQRNPQLVNDLGYGFYLNGRYKQAVDCLKQAARLAPNNSLIRTNLALAQFKLGKYSEAEKNFALANGEYEAHFNMAMMFERAGKNEQAILQFESARRISATPIVLNQLANLYKVTGRSGEPEATPRAVRVADVDSVNR
jgi:Flp pilus assembly protein TadD